MQGQLFTQDFLTRGVKDTPPWQALTHERRSDFHSKLSRIYAGVDGFSSINEAQTESEVITKVLAALGWADALALGDPQAQKHSVGYGQFTHQQFTREYLNELHEATLVLLYRLLFLFHAEDRNLLPVREANYGHYSFQRIRASIRGRDVLFFEC